MGKEKKKPYGPRAPTSASLSHPDPGPVDNNKSVEQLVSEMQNLESPTRISRFVRVSQNGTSSSSQNNSLASVTSERREQREERMHVMPYPTTHQEASFARPRSVPLSSSDLLKYLLYRPFSKAKKRPKLHDSRSSNVSQGHRSTVTVPMLTPGAQTRALNIYLITDLVFKMLSMKDLKSCRLTSKHFNLLSTSALEQKIKDSKFVMPFKYHWGLGRFVRDTENEGRIHSADYLTTLNECLEINNTNDHLSSFPCKYFAFELGTISSPDISKFFSLYGHHIQSISLTYEELDGSADHNGPLKDLLLFLNQIPSVENLEIVWCHHVPSAEETVEMVKSHVQIPLPKLKSLKFPFSVGLEYLVQKLVMSAPNLQELEISHNPHLLQTLCEMGKTHLFKKFNFFPAFWNFESIMSFADTNPVLRCFKIELFQAVKRKELWPVVTKLLNKFFVAGWQSLEQMEIVPLGFLGESGLVLPVLQNLRELSFQTNYGDRIAVRDEGPYFPKATIVQRTFPNLKLVKFHRFALKTLEYSLDVQFPPDGFQNLPLQRFPSVVDMELDRISTTAVHHRFAELFPNVTNLSIGFNFVFEAIEILWNCWPSTLESIDLKSLHFVFSEYPVLDSIITGIPESRCSVFREWPTPVQNPEEWRLSTSICNLQRLKSFKIGIARVDDWPSDHLTNPFLSHVSGSCAFKLMPQLKVIIEVSSRAKPAYTKTALGSVLPYVTII